MEKINATKNFSLKQKYDADHSADDTAVCKNSKSFEEPSRI